jgi:ComF family protein
MAIGYYGGVVRDLVLRMKKSRNESLSLAAGSLLSQRVEQTLQPALPDLVAPVPMHWMRRLTRGVNAAELVAESVAKRLHRPLYIDLLRCRRKTRKQGTLTPHERRKNVRGAYSIFRTSPLRDAHVLLIDDVMTTGATANELAKVMLRGGAREVSIAVVARGVGFD